MCATILAHAVHIESNTGTDEKALCSLQQECGPVCIMFLATEMWAFLLRVPCNRNVFLLVSCSLQQELGPSFITMFKEDES